MRKVGKFILTVIVTVLFLAALGLTALNFGIKLVDRSGWSRSQSGAVYYLDWEGDPQTGWKTIDGNCYYFDPQRGGAMAQGWLELETGWYYFGNNGIMQTGWLDLSSSRFYLREDGTMASGWQEVDGDLYYFKEDGQLTIGWMEQDGRRFYLGVDGKAVFGWQETAGGICYLASDGEIYSGWQEIDGCRYYFSGEGFLTYGWLAYENEYYYLDASGIMQTGWLETDAGWYYLNDDGAMQTAWLDLPEGRYFMGTDGIRNIGWVDVGSYRYYLGEDGVMQTGWLEYEGQRYYLNADGKMHTGWLETDEQTYYMKNDGTIAVGQLTIDGVNRFFSAKGEPVLLVNGWNPVPADYQPDLVEYGEYLIDKSCLEALQELLIACQQEGFEYSVNSIYRSLEDQQEIWDSRYAQYLEEGMTEAEALAQVSSSVAVPGYSEHHLGLAVDLGGSDEMYQWIQENCWKYGFIIRYPEGKTEATGIIYEPWHLRYLGMELALEIYESGLCMEEYFAMLTN